jgi:hypothetical protein
MVLLRVFVSLARVRDAMLGGVDEVGGAGGHMCGSWVYGWMWVVHECGGVRSGVVS